MSTRSCRHSPLQRPRFWSLVRPDHGQNQKCANMQARALHVQLTSFSTVIQQSHGPTLPASWMVHKAVQVLPHHMPSFQTSRQAVSASSSNCVRDGCTVATSEHRFATWHTVQYKPSKPVCGTHPTQNPQGLTRPRVWESFKTTAKGQRLAAEHRMERTGKPALHD